jgi:hypothetical protein
MSTNVRGKAMAFLKYSFNICLEGLRKTMRLALETASHRHSSNAEEGTRYLFLALPVLVSRYKSKSRNVSINLLRLVDMRNTYAKRNVFQGRCILRTAQPQRPFLSLCKYPLKTKRIGTKRMRKLMAEVQRV